MDRVTSIDVEPIDEGWSAVTLIVAMDLPDAVEFTKQLNDWLGYAEREVTVMGRLLAQYLYERNQEIALF